jgi:hypothetical protein
LAKGLPGEDEAPDGSEKCVRKAANQESAGAARRDVRAKVEAG